jgi:signal transduction histidine kinase
MDRNALVERLAAHRMLGGAPRAELEWLATHGDFARIEKGEFVSRKGDAVDYMAMRYMLEAGAGEVSALLPFSRMRSALADVLVEETVEAVVVYRDSFPEMIQACPIVVETLVHYMLDRSRLLAATTMQDDKMMAMGRMAAGLAHELNNPASAAARSAKMLHDALIEARQAWRALCAAQLAARSLIPVTTGVFSAIERADREDEVSTWLEDHGADHGPAEILAESGVTPDILDELAGDFSGPKLDVVLRWVAADYTARSLSIDVERAAERIHDLVSSVKRFAYMDRAAALEPTNVAQGLIDTVAVLATKAKAKSVAIRLDVPSDLPQVSAHAGELNQVWANLIENAIDAVASNGEINVNAAREDGSIIVRVLDNGPGIPEDVRSRIFEPFFTTKPIGQGTGLGLDIALSAVRAHNGQLTVDSRPGHTEFRVSLPLEAKSA